MVGIGTIVNAGTVIAGSILGVAIHSRLPRQVVNIVFQCMGLFTMVLGIRMALGSGNILIAVISLVIGSVAGQLIDIDRYLHRISDFLHSKSRKTYRGESDETATAATDGNRTTDASNFAEGFITASMIFCVGSMAILGAIEDGMGITPNLLYTKSIMDGVVAVVLASSFGISVIFSCLPLLIYQGALTILAGLVMRLMSETMIADLTAVGGIMLIGMGLTILKIKEIKVVNMLPALIVIIILSYFWG